MAAMFQNEVQSLTKLAETLGGMRSIASDRVRPSNGDALVEYFILGRWRTDQFGQFARCTFELGGKPIDLGPILPPVVRCDEVFRILPGLECTSRYAPLIPAVEDRCPECERPFDVASAYDALQKRIGLARPHFFHPDCAPIWLERTAMPEYAAILSAAGWERAVLTATPNRYWPEAYHPVEPWCLARTHLGTIEIGWRKRVIAIDWSDIVARRVKGKQYPDRDAISQALDAHVLFPGEDVTKDGAHIHAWGNEKAVEYLTKIRVALAGMA